MSVLNEQDFKILWANDWYDGPLSGMALYEDEKCYFFLDDRTFEEETKKHKEVYKIYKLTPEQISYEEEKHKCFIENVGNSFDFTTKERISHPQEKWSNFYSKYPIEGEDAFELTYQKNELIGDIVYGETIKCQ